MALRQGCPLYYNFTIGKSGEDSKRYQEKEVRQAIEEVNK